MATKTKTSISRKQRDEWLSILCLALAVVFFVLTLTVPALSTVTLFLAAFSFGLFVCFLMESDGN